MKLLIVFLGLIALGHCCEYKCPNSKRAVSNPSFKPSPNGCGTQKLNVPGFVIPNSGFVSCCNNHDYCYGRCNSNKVTCDNSFRTCMRNTCSTTGCRTLADLFYNGVKVLGCGAYKNAQGRACKCV